MNLYDVTIPVLDRSLGNLSALLRRGEEFAGDKGLEPQSIIGSRLTPDMYPLSSQVHIATDTAKGCACRLAGKDVPKWADTEVTFEDLQARIARTRDLLSSFDRNAFDDAQHKPIMMRFAGQDLIFLGLDYVNSLALPNFYFHLSVAYSILRVQGVTLGKFDFLGKP
ncbi:DUF1993 domain-containing protein [Tateyamaria sp. SN3-11]|uniref:DUF1993 domain-containing protein n=1 Tax=Tateyamaria sp. SN3-11 TaxID=3092147 RepID=UPI0039EBE3D6